VVAMSCGGTTFWEFIFKNKSVGIFDDFSIQNFILLKR
jgi:hypothetical protein